MELQTIQNLPATEIIAAKSYMDASTATATKKAYASDWAIFTAWCDSKCVESLPATPEVVALFLSAQAREGKKAATIGRRLASISSAHKAVGLDSPASSMPVQALLRGIRRKHGCAQDQKTPATSEIVREMARSAPNTKSGIRDRALLLLGFAGAFRRSELAALTIEDLGFTPEGVRVSIRRSKTDQEGKGQVKAIPFGGLFCPVRAVKEWLKVSGITEGPLFRSVRKNGVVNDSRLTTKSIGQIVKRAASSIGLDPKDFSGHSLRSGFCTSAAKNGADLFKIMDVTGHKNLKTLKGYVRRGQEFNNHPGEGLL
jgi:site-specific recombinase XerD